MINAKKPPRTGAPIKAYPTEVSGPGGLLPLPTSAVHRHRNTGQP